MAFEFSKILEKNLSATVQDRLAEFAVLLTQLPEKPALESEQESEASEILIKIISAPAAFPVDILAQVPVPAINSIFGKVHAELPRPELTVASTRWELFLPDDLLYTGTDSNLEAVKSNQGAVLPLNESAPAPIAQSVQFNGHRLVFQRQYGTVKDPVSYATVAYTSGFGTAALEGCAMFAAIVAFIGLLILLDLIPGGHVAGIGAVLLGAGLTAYLSYIYGPPLDWPVGVVVLGLLGLGAWWKVKRSRS